jgi:hypothetical protein
VSRREFRGQWTGAVDGSSGREQWTGAARARACGVSRESSREDLSRKAYGPGARLSGKARTRTASARELNALQTKLAWEEVRNSHASEECGASRELKRVPGMLAGRAWELSERLWKRHGRNIARRRLRQRQRTKRRAETAAAEER